MPLPAVNEVPWEQLFTAASEARRLAYAPYSKFLVGAAALFEDGLITSGCNVENASYGLAMCAERNAIGAAIAKGKKKLLAIAIVVDSKEPTPPCGMCRQVMAEFGDPELPVRMRNLEGAEGRYTLKELLPHAFTKKFL
jgi:cytidine deaminase